MDTCCCAFTSPCDAPIAVNPEAVSPFFYTAPNTGTSGSGEVWVSGLNIRTGSSVGQPQPPPVPAGWTNPNPGALALLWAAEAGGVQVRWAVEVGGVQVSCSRLS
jgi:hypothetical protein